MNKSFQSKLSQLSQPKRTGQVAFAHPILKGVGFMWFLLDGNMTMRPRMYRPRTFFLGSYGPCEDVY
jgi:hypothetical protein